MRTTFTTEEVPYRGLLPNQSHVTLVRLAPDESLALVKLAACSELPTKETIEELIRDMFVPRVMLKRIEALGVDPYKLASTDTYLMLWSLRLSNNPGRAVMWAYTLLLLAAEYGEKVTLDMLVQEYAMGFPDAASMDACWDKQKGHIMQPNAAPEGRFDNWLDLSVPWAFLANKFNGPLLAGGNAIDHHVDTVVELG